MPRNSHLGMEPYSAKSRRRSCVYLCLGAIGSVVGAISSWWQPNAEPEEMPRLLEERYVHVPEHAASSFMKTTTSREMSRANEIL